jgi:hypothetical protein
VFIGAPLQHHEVVAMHEFRATAKTEQGLDFSGFAP